MEAWIAGLLLREKELGQVNATPLFPANYTSECESSMNYYNCYKKPQCPCPPPCCPPPPRVLGEEAYGYFSSTAAAATTLTVGDIPLTYASDVDENIALNPTDNTEIVIQVAGDYKITYDVIATAAAAGNVQVLLNGNALPQSVVPIVAGSFGRTFLVTLAVGDTLSLATTAGLPVPAGIYASISVEKID